MPTNNAMKKRNERRPVRAAVALAGAGSLGTFLAAAVREIVIAVRNHNAAIADPNGSDDDPRILHPKWGKVTIDAIGGSSAGALCSGQLLKTLYEPSYLGVGKDIDTVGTITGDWIQFGSFDELAVEGNTPLAEDGVESPGWTFLSTNKLYDVARTALDSSNFHPAACQDDISPLPDNGIVGVGITLTDVLGYHEFAEFDGSQVLGHFQFGAGKPKKVHFHSLEGREVRDLGVRQHSEIRKIFVGMTPESKNEIQHFLRFSRRTGQATGYIWKDATKRLASLAAASAALPFGLGPMALTDPIEDTDKTIRRLYMDGGVLNNKPVSPALMMARWHDDLRLISAMKKGQVTFDPDTVSQVLDYERVCFFIDAFPDRTRAPWRSPHPSKALINEPTVQMEPENVEKRNERIDEALRIPSKGIGMFMESLLTSLRAQDMRGVAAMNYQVSERASFIRSLVGKLHYGSSDFQLTDLRKAQAYAAVDDATRDRNITTEEKHELADVIYQADRFARMRGRRAITFIPVFAPENLVEVLAGESLFAIGGLLSKEARLHDAKTGQRVARYVLQALRDGAAAKREEIPPPQESDLPSNADPLVKRIQVFANAAIRGDETGSSFVRGLVAFPFHFNPLVTLMKKRLSVAIRGEPRDDGGGR